MSYYDIQDFRTTRLYEHAKTQYPDEDLQTLACLYSGVENNPSRIICIEDSVVKEFTSACTLNEVVNLEEGIYDIWLRACKNLTSVSMHIEGIGDVFTRTFDQPYDGHVQIPLYFDKNNKRIYQFMYNKSRYKNMVSFIPAVGIRAFNKVIIRINDGAQAVLYLSCMYLPLCIRREIGDKTHAFYIDGKIYHYDNHKGGYKYTDASQKQVKQPFSLCTLFRKFNLV